MAAPSLLSLGFSAASWIEHFLVHGPGDVQGQAIELDDEFYEFIWKAYRLKPNGDRKVRRAFFSRAKGRSKSGLAGFLVCYEALGPCRFDHFAEAGEISDWGYEYAEGEPVGRPLTYAEVLCVATEEGQAGNTYDGVYYMLHPDTCSPELLATYGRLDVGLTRVNLPNKRGFIEPVTSADTSADGGKSTFIVADETHLWILGRLKRLHGIMTRNLLKRKIASGWMLETSTMYAAGEGSVAEGTHAYAKAVASGRRKDDSLLFDHRQASDGYDLSKRAERLKALREAYGPAAEWMNLEAIADSYDDPQVSEAEWRRFWLNQPVPLVDGPPSVLPTWAVCKIVPAKLPPPAALGVAMDLDRVWLSLGAASADEVPHLGSVVRVRAADPTRGRAFFVAEVARICKEHAVPVALDNKGPAADLRPDLEAAGCQVLPASLDDYVTACTDLFDAVEAKEVTHGGYAELDAAVAAAGWRSVNAEGGRRVWSRKSGDVSMLEAVTLALWGASQPPTAFFGGWR